MALLGSLAGAHQQGDDMQHQDLSPATKKVSTKANTKVSTKVRKAMRKAKQYVVLTT